MKGRRQQPKPASDRAMQIDSRKYPSRDSDVSLCSSRPSSIGTGRPSTANLPSITDRSYQSSALRSINSYLASLSSPIHLRPPLPSAKDILDTFRILLSRLHWSVASDPSKLEDDLPLLLSHLRCPFNLKKSALKAPSTPHAWPSILAVLHWTVQIARYSDHLSSNPAPFHSPTNDLLLYTVESYSHFIRGDDDAANALDQEYEQKMQCRADAAESEVDALQREVEELELRLQSIRSVPSARELLEKEKGELVEDARKFNAVVESFEGKFAAKEKALEEREKELRAKVEENRRICEENEELRRQIDMQAVNVRDAERMKREMQAVEHDITDAEVERNGWEEKMWDLEATAGQKIKELEGLIGECNQAIRR